MVHLSCPGRVKDNGHRFSRTSMGNELVNCQGSHLRESQCRPIPNSVNVHLRRRMMQLRRAVLQGQKKGKCLFVLFCPSPPTPLNKHLNTRVGQPLQSCACCLSPHLGSATYGNQAVIKYCWSNQSPCAPSPSVLPALSLSPLHNTRTRLFCFPLMCCSNVTQGAN